MTQLDQKNWQQQGILTFKEAEAKILKAACYDRWVRELLSSIGQQLERFIKNANDKRINKLIDTINALQAIAIEVESSVAPDDVYPHLTRECKKNGKLYKPLGGCLYVVNDDSYADVEKKITQLDQATVLTKKYQAIIQAQFEKKVADSSLILIALINEYVKQPIGIFFSATSQKKFVDICKAWLEQVKNYVAVSQDKIIDSKRVKAAINPRKLFNIMLINECSNAKMVLFNDDELYILLTVFFTTYPHHRIIHPKFANSWPLNTILNALVPVNQLKLLVNNFLMDLKYPRVNGYNSEFEKFAGLATMLPAGQWRDNLFVTAIQRLSKDIIILIDDFGDVIGDLIPEPVYAELLNHLFKILLVDEHYFAILYGLVKVKPLVLWDATVKQIKLYLEAPIVDENAGKLASPGTGLSPLLPPKGYSAATVTTTANSMAISQSPLLLVADVKEVPAGVGAHTVSSATIAPFFKYFDRDLEVPVQVTYYSQLDPNFPRNQILANKLFKYILLVLIENIDTDTSNEFARYILARFENHATRNSVLGMLEPKMFNGQLRTRLAAILINCLENLDKISDFDLLFKALDKLHTAGISKELRSKIAAALFNLMEINKKNLITGSRTTAVYNVRGAFFKVCMIYKADFSPAQYQAICEQLKSWFLNNLNSTYYNNDDILMKSQHEFNYLQELADQNPQLIDAQLMGALVRRAASGNKGILVAFYQARNAISPLHYTELISHFISKNAGQEVDAKAAAADPEILRRFNCIFVLLADQIALALTDDLREKLLNMAGDYRQAWYWRIELCNTLVTGRIPEKMSLQQFMEGVLNLPDVDTIEYDADRDKFFRLVLLLKNNDEYSFELEKSINLRRLLIMRIINSFCWLKNLLPIKQPFRDLVTLPDDYNTAFYFLGTLLSKEIYQNVWDAITTFRGYNGSGLANGSLYLLYNWFFAVIDVNIRNQILQKLLTVETASAGFIQQKISERPELFLRFDIQRAHEFAIMNIKNIAPGQRIAILNHVVRDFKPYDKVIGNKHMLKDFIIPFLNLDEKCYLLNSLLQKMMQQKNYLSEELIKVISHLYQALVYQLKREELILTVVDTDTKVIVDEYLAPASELPRLGRV